MRKTEKRWHKGPKTKSEADNAPTEAPKKHGVGGSKDQGCTPDREFSKRSNIPAPNQGELESTA